MKKQLINGQNANSPKKKTMKHRHHEQKSSSQQLPYLVPAKKVEEAIQEVDPVKDKEEGDDKENAPDVIHAKAIIEPEPELLIKEEEEPVRDAIQPIKTTVEQDMKHLAMLKREYKKEKETTVMQLGNISSEYNQKKAEIRKMAKDNKILFDQIREIIKEPNVKEKFFKIYQVKNYLLNQSILTYEDTIKRQTIEQAHLTKSIEESKAEKDFIEKLFNQCNNTEDDINNIIPSLTDELKAVKAKATSIKEVILQLHKISSIHKNCDRTNKNLMNTINLLTKQYENDKQQYSYASQDKKTNDVSFNSNNSSFASMITDNRVPISLMRVRAPYYLSSLKKPGILNSEGLRRKENNRSMPLIEIGTKRKDLFDNEEMKVLIKWIPSKKISDYEMRYNAIKIKKKEIEEKMLSRSSSQKGEIKLKKAKYEENIKRLNKLKEETTQLQNDCCLSRKRVAYYKNKINDTKALIQSTSKEIIQKEKDFDILLNHYHTITKRLNITKEEPI